ncbi:MAG: cupin domain-containing protein, partial [Bacilli bacterium]|nr:cupin domain-containing protein [Bacilli bacterium]
VIVTLNPNAKTTMDMPHEGQEFGYVLEGVITLHVGSKEYKCKKGETFYFTTDRNHYIENKEKKLAKVIWVSSPPNF